MTLVKIPRQFSMGCLSETLWEGRPDERMHVVMAARSGTCLYSFTGYGLVLDICQAFVFEVSLSVEIHGRKFRNDLQMDL